MQGGGGKEGRASLGGRRLAALALTALVAVPLVGAWLLTRNQATALGELTPEPARVVTPVGAGQLDYGSPATLTVAYPAPPALRASGYQGTITEIWASRGAQITSGVRLYSVDYVEIRAFSGDAVLYRPIGSGDRGTDVAALQGYLADVLAVDLTVDGVAGRATVSAIRSYEHLVGMTDTMGVFNPEWVIRLPEGTFVVSLVDLELGGIAPERGHSVLEGQAVPVVELGAQSSGPDGEYTFWTASERVPVERIGGEWVVSDASALGQLALRAHEEDRLALEGRVALAEPRVGQVVPGASLITGGEDSYCVLLEDGRRGDVIPLATTIEGGVLTEATLPSDSRVVVNPTAQERMAGCPSS